MSRRSDVAAWALLVGIAALVAGGCVTTPPAAWKVGPERVSETACGSWAQVNLVDDIVIEGEVLAVDASVVYLYDGEALHSIPVSRIDNTTTVYSSDLAGGIGAWTAGGVLSTVTHGGTLLFSGPIWLITGVSAAAVEKSTGRNTDAVPSRKRARFPQGLPPSFRKKTEPLHPSRADSIRAPELAGGCPPSKKEQGS